MSSLPQIFFHTVEKTPVKLLAIYRICHHVFSEKEPVTIRVSDKKTALFVDDLLWKMPLEGFIPHEIADQTTLCPIAISTEKRSPNGSRTLLNLTSQAVNPLEEWNVIYELEDRTSEEKLENAKQRYRHYEQKGCKISFWLEK